MKVNKEKSKVSRPTASTLLGFSFYNDKGKWEVRLSKKSIERIKSKSKKITARNTCSNSKQKILKMKPIIQGWVYYFSIAKAQTIMQQLHECVRTRLRMGLCKARKTSKTRIFNLFQLKAGKHKSYEWGNSSRGYCRVAHSQILCATLNNAYFSRQGYVGFSNTYKRVTEENQTSLF